MGTEGQRRAVRELGLFAPHTYSVFVNASLGAVDAMVDVVESGGIPDDDDILAYTTIRHELDHYRAFVSTPLGMFLDQAYIISTDYLGGVVKAIGGRGPLRLPRPLWPHLDAVRPQYQEGGGESVENALFVLHTQLRSVRIIQHLFAGGTRADVLGRGALFAQLQPALRHWARVYFPDAVFQPLVAIPERMADRVRSRVPSMLEVMEGSARSAEYVFLARLSPALFERLKPALHFGEYATAIDRVGPIIGRITSDLHSQLLTLRALIDLALCSPLIPEAPALARRIAWTELHPGLRFEAIVSVLPDVGPVTSVALKDYEAWVGAVCSRMDPEWTTPMNAGRSIATAKRHRTSMVADLVESQRLLAARLRSQQGHLLPFAPFFSPGSPEGTMIERLYPPLLIGDDGFASGDLGPEQVARVSFETAVLTARHETLCAPSCPDTLRLLKATTFDRIADADVARLVESATGIAL